MTQPSVIIHEQDGTLGMLPPSAGKLLAVVGPASSGPDNVPSTFARTKDLIAAFGGGPAVEAAAHSIATYGRPVIFVKSAASVAGEVGDVTSNALAGTSVVTVAVLPLPTPIDDFEIVMKIVAGGTIATAGITYQLSYDGGRTFGSITALGVAATLEIPGSGGVTLEFAPGTMIAGASFAVRTTSPAPSGADLGPALDALASSAASWEMCELPFAMDATLFDLVETKFAGLFAAGKFRSWIGNTRMPDEGETEAEYLAELTLAFGTKASVRGGIYAGACKLTSGVSGRKYRRPVCFATAAREASVSEEINIADVNLGALAGVSIRDVNGNPDEHDESLFPGLDDARFGVLRTWDGFPGVFVNRPRVFSTTGSDFYLMPHRRVMDLAHAVLYTYFVRRLNKPIRLDKTTGFILESEALEIESGAKSAMRSALLAKPKASDIDFVLSRTDNVLATKTLTGNASVLPLAYPEWIELDVGFVNPALLVQAA